MPDQAGCPMEGPRKKRAYIQRDRPGRVAPGPRDLFLLEAGVVAWSRRGATC